jgi:hypothetical protein
MTAYAVVMKQVQKTEQILNQLRASFGPDAELTSLAVYETRALNSLPLRKSGGIFKGARNSLRLLQQMADWVNGESVPLHLSHDTSGLPYGRAFHGAMVDNELRLLFAVDSMSHPEVVSKLESGVLDQVSVGFNMKSLGCSKCGFNFIGASAENFYNLTCDEGHTIGQDDVHVWVDDLEYFFELSLVGMGAAEGATIVGRSDARLANNPSAQQRLAASADAGLFGVRLSPNIEEASTMTPDQLARFEANITAAATATANLGAVTTDRDAAVAELTAANARVAELEAAALAAAPAAEVTTQLIAAQADAAAAVEALRAEATVVMTALGEEAPAEMPADVPTLVAMIAEKRAAFAAVIPVGGASNQEPLNPTPARSVGAFRTQR